MFESWWFRFLHFGVHSSSAQQERRRRLRRRWRCKWLGGGSSGCSARSTHRFPRSLHHILPDNSSPTAFGDRCCWWWCSGPLTVQAPATPPLQPPAPSAAAFPQAEIVRRLQAAGPSPRYHRPSPECRPSTGNQPILGLNFRARSAAAPLSTLVSTNSLSLASLSLQICGAPVFDPPLLQCSACLLARSLALSLSIRLSLFSWATARTATRA
jgi:hypothetical protein